MNETGVKLMNRLAEAGIPLPPRVTRIEINVDCDSVPRLRVESLLAVDQAEKLTKVLTEFEVREMPKPERIDG
jgi:hypothetical protein